LITQKETGRFDTHRIKTGVQLCSITE